MFSRFTRLFLISCIALLLVGSIFFLNPPIRVYLDPHSKEWFNEDGVPPTQETMGNATNGGVIMPKLGNETAK